MYTENMPSVAVQIRSNQKFPNFQKFRPPLINNRREHRLHTTSRGKAKGEFLARLPCPNRPKRLLARVRKSVTLDFNVSNYGFTSVLKCLLVQVRFVEWHCDDSVLIEFLSTIWNAMIWYDMIWYDMIAFVYLNNCLIALKTYYNYSILCM
jgi:hypothetical protein